MCRQQDGTPRQSNLGDKPFRTPLKNNLQLGRSVSRGISEGPNKLYTAIVPEKPDIKGLCSDPRKYFVSRRNRPFAFCTNASDNTELFFISIEVNINFLNLLCVHLWFNTIFQRFSDSWIWQRAMIRTMAFPKVLAIGSPDFFGWKRRCSLLVGRSDIFSTCQAITKRVKCSTRH